MVADNSQGCQSSSDSDNSSADDVVNMLQVIAGKSTNGKKLQIRPNKPSTFSHSRGMYTFPVLVIVWHVQAGVRS